VSPCPTIIVTVPEIAAKAVVESGSTLRHLITLDEHEGDDR
jgi:hypothetical protein